MKPLVSVVIPTYNQASLLAERSVSSILNQTYANLECLVIDDGSTDDTEQRMRELARIDGRLRYFKVPNQGQSAAKNFGVRQARGEFIAFNDHDDAYLPQYIEIALTAFSALSDNVAYLSSGVINRDEQGRESYYLPQLEPFWKLSIGNGWVFRRAAFLEHDIVSAENMSNFEDLDLHLTFHRYCQGHVIDRPLRIYYLRTKPSSSALTMTAYHQRQVRSFSNFFQRHEPFYQSLGNKAAAWLYSFGGLVHLRAGNLESGRRFFHQAYRLQPSLRHACYVATAYLGRQPFLTLEYGKSRLMRLLRSTVINRLPNNP